MADVRHRIDPLDAVAAGAVAAWLIWVVAAAALSGRPLSPLSPYLWAPLAGVAGVVVGRVIAPRAHRWPVGGTVAVIGLVFTVLCLTTLTPGKLPLRYANANAAMGVQLLVLAGLAALAQQPLARGGGTFPTRAGLGGPILAFLGAVGVLVANWSQAANVVGIPVALAALWVGSGRSGPPRWVSYVIGVTSLVGSGTAGVWLAAQPSWPAVALRALDPARKVLWGDALTLWRAHPVTGGGPGSFREASVLARDPDTATVHSSILQVGSELGLVGVALFGILLLVGLALAVRRSRPAAFVAVAGWTALGIHSFVDHLYEFTAVTFTAAVVLGWASAQNSSTSPSVNRQPDGAGGADASGRVVNKGPMPRNGTGMSPADGPVRKPMA